MLCFFFTDLQFLRIFVHGFCGSFPVLAPIWSSFHAIKQEIPDWSNGKARIVQNNWRILYNSFLHVHVQFQLIFFQFILFDDHIVEWLCINVFARSSIIFFMYCCFNSALVLNFILFWYRILSYIFSTGIVKYIKRCQKVIADQNYLLVLPKFDVTKFS